MADVTKFLMTDETGQSIAAAINAINPNDAVRYSAQTLTDAQKAQARSNIGAISEDEVDVSTKADKVDGATNGNLAGLDSNGNLTDSTIPASDVTQLKNDLTGLTDEVGRNIWDEEWVNAILNVIGEPSSNVHGICFNNFIEVCSSTTYYAKMSDYSSDANCAVYFYDSNQGFIERVIPTVNNPTFTTPNNCKYIKAYWEQRDENPAVYHNDFCINRSDSQNGTYTPFRGLRKQIFGVSNEALDIKMLGWSVPKECPIHNYMDANRKFHQRVGRVDLGNLEWRYDSSVIVFVSGNINCKNDREGIPCYSYIYTQESGSNIVSTDKDMLVCVGSTFLVSNAVVVKNLSYTDATAFKSAMNGVYLYYELANEIVTDVDGNEATGNHMISDAWNSTKTYYPGNYCIYGNQLWKCLVQNSGQAPAEGTYWHQTSVFGEMIKETTIYNETTDSSGLINIGLLTNSYTVISASSEDKVVNILKSSGGYWCVHLMQAWDCQPVKNTLISEVKVQYKNK